MSHIIAVFHVHNRIPVVVDLLLYLSRVPEYSEVGISEFKLINRSCELVNSQFELGPDRSSPTWVT